MTDSEGSGCARRNLPRCGRGRLHGDIANFSHLPNGKALLSGLALTTERLRLGSKIAVPLPALRAILLAAIAGLPFDEEFYVSAYPDIKTAYESGQIVDLRAHFVERYFEGRLGVPPIFDEAFYLQNYPDVAAAVAGRRGPVCTRSLHFGGCV
jgi:hypothetical protein